MATVVLTVVGGIIGGPVGAALGATIGGAVDRNVLLKPKGRQGPRLTELAVQTSSYGSPIPRLYGSLRVAGTVVWATDLREKRKKEGGGKGQPSTTTYSYSTSFAVLLSARRIAGVGRIWADGKLLRGAAGDFKSQTGFRLHTGSERQPADPLIAAAEGIAQTPALRGQAYAVFENFQLADYGNRIPSLTFEVIADAGPVPVGAVAADLGVAAEADGTSLTGFSAYGDSARGVLETLASVDGGWFASGGGAIELRAGPGATVEIADEGAGAGERGATGDRALASIETAPKRLALAHYDPDRDYQAGLQHALRPGPGHRAERIELPAALPASQAKALAAAMLLRAEAGRERRLLALTGGSDLMPGARVRIAGETGQWRIARATLEAMVTRLELVRVARAAAVLPAASPGRVSVGPDVVAGATVLHAFELPPLDDNLLSAPRLYVAGAGGPGWRTAAVLLSTDGGTRWAEAGAIPAPTLIGKLASAPGPGESYLVDRVRTFDVDLHDADAELADADDAALDAGANLALVGDELVQFGRAEPIGAGRWRLSELWRGRRGTEYAAGTQSIGDRFILLERDALLAIDLPLSALGAEARLLAGGIGDRDGPAAASLTVTGAAIRPPAPVAMRWTGTGDGGATVVWTRRSRAGWAWRDGGDVPLAEENESWRVMTGARETTLSAPPALVTAADRAAAAVAVTVRQRGSLAESPAATLTIPAP